MIFEQTNYRVLLKAAWSEKAAKGKGYSLRSLARKVGVSPSFLSEMLNGKKSLSMDLAFKIAVKLGLTETETQNLCLLAQLENEQDPDFRSEILKRINHLHPRKKTHDLSTDLFKVIADWYHFAILEMTHLPGFRLRAESISKSLNISKIEAEVAIERLLRLELLEKTAKGSYRKTHDYVLAQSQISAGALRQFHRQYLEKAQLALEAQSPRERVSATDVLPLNSKYLPEVDRLSREFSSAVLRLSEKTGTKDAVYALGVHCFRLTTAYSGEKS
ncbi:MAG: TIGR02147 family protein [Bacteriovoracia bacterium]